MLNSQTVSGSAVKLKARLVKLVLCAKGSNKPSGDSVMACIGLEGSLRKIQCCRL